MSAFMSDVSCAGCSCSNGSATCTDHGGALTSMPEEASIEGPAMSCCLWGIIKPFTHPTSPPNRAPFFPPMPPKRRVPDAADDDEPAAPAAMPLREETADLIATRLCRFVLLREHMRKPATRSEIKDAVMTKEQKAQDRSGKIFKQVLAGYQRVVQ